MSGSVTWLRRLLIVAFALSTLRTAESVVWGRLSTVASWLKPAELHTPDLVEGYVRYDENDGTFSFVNGLAAGAEGEEKSPSDAGLPRASHSIITIE